MLLPKTFYTVRMAKTVWILVCFVFGFAAEAQLQIPKVLFVGNSHTYVNNIPELVQKMAATQGIQLEVSAITAGGYRLEDHVADGKVQAALKSEKFTVVILQEQSGRPVLEAAAFKASVQQLAALAKTAKTQVVLYVSWSRADLEAQGYSQKNWDTSFTTVATATQTKLAPVGTAWANAVKAGVQIEKLRSSDGVHAAPAGSYLTALTIYSSLVGLNPLGLPKQFKVSPSATDQELSAPINLEAGLAKTLQIVAWQTVKAVKTNLKPKIIR